MKRFILRFHENKIHGKDERFWLFLIWSKIIIKFENSYSRLTSSTTTNLILQTKVQIELLGMQTRLVFLCLQKE